jgi:hypothetical protein
MTKLTIARERANSRAADLLDETLFQSETNVCSRDTPALTHIEHFPIIISNLRKMSTASDFGCVSAFLIADAVRVPTPC